MYRGLTIFKCTNCGHTFKSHDIEYRATSLSVPQRCPQCGSVRTMPIYDEECLFKDTYKRLWEEIEQIEKKWAKAEAKRKAFEKELRKKQAKKRRHMSRGQKEKQDRQREKKAAKRSKRQQLVEPKREEIIVLSTTWFPPGTPLKIDEERKCY